MMRYKIVLFIILPFTVFCDQITQVSALSFGLVIQPTIGSNNITINPTDGSVSGNYNIISSTTLGRYNISCDNSGDISLDIQATNPADVTVTDIQANYQNATDLITSFPATGLTNPGTGAYLYIGGTFNYTNSSVAQVYNIPLTIVLTCP